jgi:hypothetical protein|tara:strand:+ start:583 stop:807 length:225 start_codon:yes stop_codon:yes gene_type:complete
MEGFRKMISMDKIYYLTYKGEKIPYQFTSLKETIVLNFNKKDYPDKINNILKNKYPGIKYIQHHTHYTELKRGL